MSTPYTPPDLSGRVALVTGATRGAGRGIAVALGEAGATVYCTGRSSRTTRNLARGGSLRLETIEETAERVTVRGGIGIPAVVNHMDRGAVQSLIATIEKEQRRLDILVNVIWGGDPFLEFGKPFWQLDLPKGFQMIEGALYTHVITSHFATPLLIESSKKSSGGLIVEVTDGDSYQYRGNLFYDLVKTGVIRLAFGMARELRHKNVTVVALTPGFLRTEIMLDQFGVTEATWRDAVKKDPSFEESETPMYSGRAVAALAADPKIASKSGRVFSSWGLSDEYGFCDTDGRKPHWGNHAKRKYGNVIKPCDDGFYQYWTGGMVDSILPNWP